MEIIITIPHGFCPERRFRMCDNRASEAATMLSRALRDRLPRNIQIRVFYSNSPRSFGDLNRSVTRDTPWRRRVQFHVERAVREGSKVILFDMHSFPNSCDSFCKSQRDTPPQVVLLDSAGFPHRKLVESIRNSNAVERISLLQGSTINDITEMARAVSDNVDTMLWEFNENRSALSDQEITSVVLILAEYVIGKLSVK